MIYVDPVLDLAMRPWGSPYKNDVGVRRKMLKEKKKNLAESCSVGVVQSNSNTQGIRALKKQNVFV